MSKPSLIFWILLLGFFLRLVNLNQSFWLDEAAQVIESIRPLSEQLNIVADFHPPGFHLLLHYWMKIGTSEVWIRLLSVIFGVGSIYFTYKLATVILASEVRPGSERSRWPSAFWTSQNDVGLLTSLFLAISPFHIWYSQEARPYMMFVFFTVLSTYFLIRKRWAWYGISVAGLLYSVYFSFFLLFGHIVFVFIFERKAIYQYIKSVVPAYLLFIPWLPLFMQQLQIGTGGFFQGWTDVVSPAPWKAIPLTFAKFIFGKGSIDNNFIYALVIAPVCIIFLYSIFHILRSKDGKHIVTLFAIPFLSISIVAFFLPIVAPQRLIFLLPFFLLILANGIAKMQKKWKYLSVCIVMLTSASGIVQYYVDPTVQREQWRQAVTAIEKEGVSQAAALFVFPGPFAPYLWYNTGVVEGIGIAPTFHVRQEDLVSLNQKLDGVSRIYLFQYLTGLTDTKEETRSFLEKRGFVEIEVKNFPGVGFIWVYERTILSMASRSCAPLLTYCG